MTLKYQEVKYNSALHKKTITLRDEILRKPLGLKFTKEQLAEEQNSHHLACFDQNDNCLACLILKPISDDICKMRQVAVSNQHQGQGLGRSIVEYFETFAKSKGFKKIDVHARLTAVPFYKKLNYKKDGELFYEVDIPHYYMFKEI